MVVQSEWMKNLSQIELFGFYLVEVTTLAN